MFFLSNKTNYSSSRSISKECSTSRKIGNVRFCGKAKSTPSTFVLPNILFAVIWWCFSAMCCCGGNGPTLCRSHEKPNPNLNENLNLMWCLLVVHEFCWNFNMLFISIVSNSFGNLFEINKSLLNWCVVKIFAFILSTNCSALECGGYLRDLALLELALFQYHWMGLWPFPKLTIWTVTYSNDTKINCDLFQCYQN